MSLGDKFLITLEASKLQQQRGLGEDEVWNDTRNRTNIDNDKTSSHCFAEDEVWDRRKERKLYLTKRMSNRGKFDEEVIWDSHLEKRKTTDSLIKGLWIAYGLLVFAMVLVKKVDSCIYYK